MEGAEWNNRGFVQLEAVLLLGSDAAPLLRHAAAAATELLARAGDSSSVAQPSWVSAFAFPFPGEADGKPPSADGALNRLAVHDGFRVLAEQLLCTESGGVRVVTSRLLVNDQLADCAALTLCPDTNDTSEALELFVPLVDSDCATVMARKFDPRGAHIDAAAAVDTFRHAHPLALRTILRTTEATHIQCDSSQQNAPGLAELLRGLSPIQRNLAFGFPVPGHPYWDRGTLAATVARYALDPTPYLSALPTASIVSDAAQQDVAEQGATSAPKPEGWTPLAPATWQSPDQALPLDSADVLTPAQVQQWHEKGWLVMDNIWPR